MVACSVVAQLWKGLEDMVGVHEVNPVLLSTFAKDVCMYVLYFDLLSITFMNEKMLRKKVIPLSPVPTSFFTTPDFFEVATSSQGGQSRGSQLYSLSGHQRDTS